MFSYVNATYLVNNAMYSTATATYPSKYIAEIWGYIAATVVDAM